MLRVTTDNSHHTIPFNYFAVRTSFFYTCADFHSEYPLQHARLYTKPHGYQYPPCIVSWKTYRKIKITSSDDT